MRKYLVVVTLACIAIGSFSVDAFALFKSTKFTVVVLNEEDEPLSGIHIGVGFEKNTGWGTDSTGQRGITGTDGKLTFSGKAMGILLMAEAKKATTQVTTTTTSMILAPSDGNLGTPS